MKTGAAYFYSLSSVLLSLLIIPHGMCINVTYCLEKWDCKWGNDVPYSPTMGECLYILPWHYPIDGPSSLAPEGSCNLVVDCQRRVINSTEMFECIRLLSQPASVESLLLYRCSNLEIKNGDLDFLQSLKEFNITYSLITEIQERAFYYTSSLVTLDFFPDYDDVLSVTEYPKALIGPEFDGRPNCSVIDYNDFLPNLKHLIFHNFVFANGIPETAFNCLSNLETLTFSFVTLRNSDFLSLRYWANLTHFEIYDSRDIDWLPTEISPLMPSLRHFEISSTNISSITSKHFRYFRQLETLKLSWNMLTDIDANAFQNQNNLKSLSLAWNENLKSVPFLDKLTQLESLDLSHCAISNFSLEVFSRLDKLTALTLNNNRLREVPPFFKNFPNAQISLKNIEYIDLSRNEIIVVDNYTFSNLMHLKSIDLHHNNITKIGFRSFFNLRSLTNVDLAVNRIDTIDPGAFYGVDTLETLDLQWNVLRNFPKFKGLNWVETDWRDLPKYPVSTDIRSNPLRCDCDMFRGLFVRIGKEEWILTMYYEIRWPGDHSLSNQLFTYSTSLTCFSPLDGTRTNIDYMLQSPERWFSRLSGSSEPCPSSCRCLLQCTNDQFYGMCNDANLTSIPSGISSSVSVLSLKGNRITRLNSSSFAAMPNIATIHMEHNDISVIEDGAFLGLSSLREIVLHHNNLTAIHPNTFNISSPLFTYLDLSFNQIASIDPRSFLSVSSLQVLMLRNNNLETISPGSFDNLLSLSALSVSENPFNCTCDLLYLTDWYTQIAFAADRNFRSDVAELGCAPYLNETELYQWIEHQNAICNPELISFPTAAIVEHKQSWLFMIIAVLTTAAATALISVLIYKFRLELLVLIYVKTGLKLFTDSDSEDEKQYDAFISFSSLDRQFVLDELVPKLESETHKRRLCIHHRDFVVGECIATNIINAIESSKKIVILCSRNYLESEWCSYEFKTSHQQALRDRGRRIVLIMMEDVKKSALDKEIKAYISTNTYLERKDPLFWSKLLYSVPATSLRNDEQSNEINSNKESHETWL